MSHALLTLQRVPLALSYKRCAAATARAQMELSSAGSRNSTKMPVKRTASNLQRISQLVCLMVALLWRGCLCGTYSESEDDVHYASMGANFFRFRDFVPRSGTGSGVTTEGGHVGGSRKARGFQFHVDDKDLNVNMEFIVPFARVPVERSMEMATTAMRSLVNLQTGALLWTGLIVGVGALVALIVKTLNTPVWYNYGKQTRAGETFYSNAMDPFNLVSFGSAQNGTAPGRSVMKVNDLMSAVESKLQQGHIDMTACVQKSICTYLKQASTDVRLGTGTSWTKIVDGFASLAATQTFLSGTALQSAIEAAHDTHTCDYTYRSCKWLPPENKFLKFLFNFLTSSLS